MILKRSTISAVLIMIKFSIQAAHEQVNPLALLDDVLVMEKNGIGRCWTSDHYMPWWNTGASGGAAWPWLGAALARTNSIVIGTGITPPILRYNPAIVAQVFATLGFMFPGRVFLTVGRGEALNEVPSGNRWPPSRERFERLKEAIQIIKALWNEDWVSFKGKYYALKDSKLYTKPKVPIPLYVAGIGPQSATLAGEQADGFVTNELSADKIKNKIFPALKDATNSVGKDYDSMEKVLFIPGSYDEDKQKAIKSISFWKGAMIKAFFDVDVHDPRKIEENGQVVGDDIMQRMLLVASSAKEAIEKLQVYVELGFTEVVITNSSPDRSKLINLLAKEVIPHFSRPH
jgi:coenzyme F420-dependent glucose-6-phosphate dehydrogenase